MEINPKNTEPKIPQTDIHLRKKARINYDESREDYLFSCEDMIENDEPTIREALNNQKDKEKWLLAIDEEIRNLEQRGTWEIIDRPEKASIISSRFVLKRKRDSQGKLTKYKARLVARGFTQTKGVDYQETFSPVITFHTLVTCLVIATHLNYEIHQVDINSAYLNAELNETIIMSPPEGLDSKKYTGKVLRLKKTLYGLKQSGREWHHLLKRTLSKYNWKSNEIDRCLFPRLLPEGNQTLLVYVDDMVIIAPNSCQIQQIKDELEHEFSLKNLGELQHLLGIELKRDRKLKTLSLNQKGLITKIGKNIFNMPVTKPKMPLKQLTIELQNTPDGTQELLDKYQSLIGSLLYVARFSRPDILYSVIHLSKFTINPDANKAYQLKWLIIYLSSTINQELSINCTNIESLTGYTDADWGGDKDDRKSISGYAIYLGKALISFKSKKQPIVAQSTMEAEYIAMNEGTRELIGIKNIIESLGIKLKSINLLTDNNAAICISKDPKDHERTKHIDIKYHYVRELVMSKIINIYYVNSKMNIADIFTKSQNSNDFNNAKQFLGVSNSLVKGNVEDQ